MNESFDEFGQWLGSKDVSVFFGNQRSQEFTVDKNIQFGHQVHKANLIKIEDSPEHSQHLIENSDGLWTDSANLLLGIYTADCIPCFVLCDRTLFGLHLGWRSLHLGLFEEALAEISRLQRSKSASLQIFIGPHIRIESFEVGAEVFEKFHDQLPDSLGIDWFTRSSKDKYKISLEQIIRLKAAGFKSEIYSSEIDTFISKAHHSYRREKATPERNISFAFLK